MKNSALKMKRNLNLIGLLTTAVVILLLQNNIMVTTQADDTVYTYGYFEYYINNEESCVKSYFGSESNVVIPDYLGECPVTNIMDYAFAGNNNIKTLTLPSTLTDIGSNALSGMTNLKLVVNQSVDVNPILPEGVEIQSDYPLYVDENGKLIDGSNNDVNIVQSETAEATGNLNSGGIIVDENYGYQADAAFDYEDGDADGIGYENDNYIQSSLEETKEATNSVENGSTVATLETNVDEEKTAVIITSIIVGLIVIGILAFKLRKKCQKK